MIGTLLRNRYRIDAKLGEGGMGVVYRAHDSLLQRPVAIKTLSPALFGEEGTRRILREAQSAAKLNHPHIVSIFDAVEEGGQFAIVMELVEGQTLRELLPVPVPRLVEITLQVLEGLEYAHAQGIVHRDIKPENIIVTKEGTAKLMDFGLARSEGRSRLTVTGMVVGTVAYLAPEQALGGQVDGRSDLYALGAVLYEAVAGRPPFESEDPISVITQHINVPPVAPHWHNPAIPPSLENVILKLLAKDPARRYQSAKEALEALRAILPGLTTSASAGPPATTGGEKLAGPELVERLARSPLAGREPELDLLKGLVDQTMAGRGAVALVGGPLGIGKTRLLEEAATFARLRGVVVVSGKAYESAPPYGPIARALRELARGVDSDTLATRMGPFASDLAALIPELVRQLPRLPERPAGAVEDQKSRLFSGIAQFLASTAASVPVLLQFDDMHLCDHVSAELLDHLVRTVELSRVLIMMAYRPDEIPATPAGRAFGRLVHELGREGYSRYIAVRPLTEDQVTDLLKLMANHPDRPVRFGRRIFSVTGGNPYFIEEVVKGLFERGTLYIKDGRWSTDFDDVRDYSLMEVPASINDAVEARLRHLSDPARQILTHAAVIGQQFSFDLLLAVTGEGEAALLDRVEETLRTQLIREVRAVGEDVYEFAQPMLRQVLYEAVPRRRRRLLHRQVAEALERAVRGKPEASPDALAYHFTQAEDVEKVLTYASLAARRAASLFAYDDAVRYLREAIAAAEELERPNERLELLEAVGDILMSSGRIDQAFLAYEDALKFWKSLPGGSRGDGAGLYRKLGLGRRFGVNDPRTREYIDEGLRLLADTPLHPERVRLIIARAFDHFWRRPEAERDYRVAAESAAEGYRLAEEIGSLKDMSAALDALAGIHGHLAEFTEELEATRKRIPIVERLDDPTERIDLQGMLTAVHEDLGEFAQAVTHAEQTYQLGTTLGRFGYQLGAVHSLIRIHWKWNRWDEAERWCAVADQIPHTDVRPGVRRVVAAFRCFVAGIRGHVEEAQRFEREFESVRAGDPAFAWASGFLRLFMAWTLGDLERARTLADEALRLADGPSAKLEVGSLVLQFAADAGLWSYVEAVGEDTLQLARRAGARFRLGLVSGALGVYHREHGRFDDAEKSILEARELFQVLDCPWYLGRTLRELALLRRAQGRGDEASALLRDALTHFEFLGATREIERTHALM